MIPVRPDLLGDEPYGAPQLDVPVLLNVNENPYSPSEALTSEIATAVKKAAQRLNRYPDRDFHELREALAQYLARESGVHINPMQIWAANGSNEIMLQILQAFGGPGRCATTLTPSYSMYPEYARDSFTSWVEGSRNPDFTIDLHEVSRLLAEHHPAVLFLASPNNPTGTALDTDVLREILEMTKASGPYVAENFVAETHGESTRVVSAQSTHGLTVLPHEMPARAATLVVVDEAYAEFRRAGVASAMELIEEYEHVIVTRTMSKAFGAAGLRLGYMAASQEIVNQIMLVRLPYHLSALTQAAACAALKHSDELREQVDRIRVDRDDMVAELLHRGFDVAPSDANYVFFGRFQDTSVVWQSLLDQGVLIRDVGPEGWLRVSIGTPEENHQFLNALTKALHCTEVQH